MKKIDKYSVVSLIALSAAIGGMPAQAERHVAPVVIDIAHQPMNAALQKLSQEFDIQIASFSEDISGKTVRKLSGKYTLSGALSALLDDSGLQYFRVDDRTIAVGTPARISAQFSKAGFQPISFNTAADYEANLAFYQEDEADVASDNVAVVNGAVNGRVKAIGSEAYLEGALVTIVETGQTTTTDDLGNFSFANISPGSYTLQVSYLGFGDGTAQIRVSSAEEIRQDFAMEGVFEEIIIYGSRSARAQALNQERTAENVSSVISADLLGNFTGSTISDVLRRASGVAFQRNTTTGEGSNIIVRGMSPDFNGVQLNGLNLPVGSGVGRSSDLGNLLVDSVDKITINKTLLPSHDSAGTGGLVQIETKSPLGRPDRYASFTMEGGKRGKGFGDDFQISGIVSGVFGSEKNFGLSAAVQYRETTNKTISYDAGIIAGQALPLDPGGGTGITSLRFIDPRRQFPFEQGIDQYYVTSSRGSFIQTDSSTLAVTLSGEWQVADHTSLKMDMQRSTRKENRFRRLTSITARGAEDFDSFSGFNNYQLRDVQALGGEERWALTLDNGFSVNQSYFITKDLKDVTDTISLRGETTLNKWQFNYSAGFAGATNTSPVNDEFFISAANPIASSLLLGAATDAAEGRVITPFGARTGNSNPQPLLSEAGWAIINDSGNYNFGALNGRSSKGRNNRYSGKFSGKYDFDGSHLKYIEIGVSLETSKFTTRNINRSIQPNTPPPPGGPPPGGGPASSGKTLAGKTIKSHVPVVSVASLGIDFSDVADLSDIGIDQGFQFISQPDVEALIGNIDSLTGSPTSPLQEFAFDPHPLEADTFLKEEERVAYIQSRVDVGKLEIIGGARLSQVKVNSAHLTSPILFNEFNAPDIAFANEFTQLEKVTTTETKLLPRVVLNYRHSENLIFRGGYFMSTARPQVTQLSATKVLGLFQAPMFGPDFNQPMLFIQEGNPDLKPALTNNFDFSAEYYDDNIGVIKVGVFYKRINNLLENNRVLGGNTLDDVILPDHVAFENITPENTFIDRTRPENNPSIATIWGLELQAERQFTFLPSFWSGFGIFANYTYAKSSKEFSTIWNASPVLDADGNFTYLAPPPPPPPPPGGGAPPPPPPPVPPQLVTEAVSVTYPSVSFDQQPKHSGTVALTYNKHNIDAALTYGFQSKLQTSINDFGLNGYNEKVETVDFRIEYQLEKFDGKFRIYLEARDLLKGVRDADLETSLGSSGIINGGTYLGGRSIKLGVTGSF